MSKEFVVGVGSLAFVPPSGPAVKSTSTEYVTSVELRKEMVKFSNDHDVWRLSMTLTHESLIASAKSCNAVASSVILEKHVIFLISCPSRTWFILTIASGIIYLLYCPESFG